VAEETLSESMICHPLGVRQRISRCEGLLIADLDFDALDALRAYYRGPDNAAADTLIDAPPPR
jgi:hypothetical protein